MTHINFRATLVVALSILFPTISSAASYQVVPLGTLGGTTSSGAAISEHGVVVGSADTTGNVTQLGFYDNGAMHAMPALGGTASNAQGVWDGSQTDIPAFSVNTAPLEVTGGALTSTGLTHAYYAVPSAGVMQDIGTLGGALATGIAVSNGIVVGYANTHGDINSHAFVWNQAGGMIDIGGAIFSSGVTNSRANAVAASPNLETEVAGTVEVNDGDFQTYFGFRVTLRQTSDGRLFVNSAQALGTLGGSYSFGSGVNALGFVTGESSLSDGRVHAYAADRNGSMQDLGTLGGPDSYGHAINFSNQVVGQASLASGVHHAFLYNLEGFNPLTRQTLPVGMIDLNSLIDPNSGWVLQDATGINDFGQITGTGMFNGVTEAFLLNPVPEPTTVALGTMGLVGLLAIARARRWNTRKS